MSGIWAAGLLSNESLARCPYCDWAQAGDGPDDWDAVRSLFRDHLAVVHAVSVSVVPVG